MSDKQSDPSPFADLLKVLGPVVDAFTAAFNLSNKFTALARRIKVALEKSEGLELSAEEVQTLALMLSSLSRK